MNSMAQLKEGLLPMFCELENGFLKISHQAKNREKERKAKIEAWKKEREEYLNSKLVTDKAKEKLENKVQAPILFRILLDAWLEEKFPDLSNKKLEAIYQANDEWERMGTNNYEALEILGNVSSTGGKVAHQALAGDIADALLRDGRPTGMKHVVLSAMLQDLISHTSEEIIQNDGLRAKIVNGSSRKMKNIVAMMRKDRNLRQRAL